MSLFYLPPGADFAQDLAKGFWARFGGHDPVAISDIQILVNNRRALRTVEDAFVAQAGQTRLLPRMAVLAELGAAPAGSPDLPAAIDPLRRQLRLTRLVQAYLRSEGRARAAPLAAAPELARSLARLMDEFDEEGLALDALDHAAAAEHADHWAQTLAFMDLIRLHWPEIAKIAEDGAIGPKARQRQVIEAMIAAWQSTPPRAPLIAAASTGSVTSTAELLAAIARTGEGYVVLPGFDASLPDEIWRTVLDGAAPEHPMAPFAQLFRLTGAALSEVTPWVAPQPDPRTKARHDLLAQALRPAPVTDAWHRAAPDLADGIAEAAAGLALIEAPGPRQEAAAIAAATRRALEMPGKSVLILTQDAAMARRIGAELGRFGVSADDSLGRPLAQSPPGLFLRLLAEMAQRPADPVRIAGLLQHPLMRPGCPRAEHLGHAHRYELAVLRQRGVTGAPGLPAWAEAPPDSAAWLSRITEALAPLSAAFGTRAPLDAIVAAQLDAATALSRACAQDIPQVWEKEAGQAALSLLERLLRSADAFGKDAVADYPGLLLSLMRAEEVRPEAQTPHPRVRLLSPREARVAKADLTILAGLNEGGWPSLPSPDPWLSRPMRKAIGLPSPERLIGLSAHDFLQAAAGREVILTRPLKIDGAPSVASRWLIRLETLIDGIDAHRGAPGATMAGLRARGEELLALGRITHLPDAALQAALPRAQRPSPKPPAAARPTRLSVTAIETLIRDPYAIYARRILGLDPLDPLGQRADFRDRGDLVHKVLERFCRAVPGPLPEDAQTRLMAAADHALAELIAQPDLRRIWRARIARFAPWFLAGEARRRAGVREIALEVKGKMTLAQPPDFTLTARADRIDLHGDGGAAIYDYKAGAPPSKKQVENGFNQQLHLQAAILAEGGFEGLAEAEAHLGAYLGLTGSAAGGKETEIPDLMSKVADHVAGVEALLSAYADPETGYTARRMVQLLSDAGDYDHLARFGEWEAGDD